MKYFLVLATLIYFSSCTKSNHCIDKIEKDFLSINEFDPMSSEASYDELRFKLRKSLDYCKTPKKLTITNFRTISAAEIAIAADSSQILSEVLGEPDPNKNSKTDVPYDRTLLHLAVYYGSPNAFKLLVERGHDLSREDSNGVTPFMFLEGAKGNRLQLEQLFEDQKHRPSNPRDK